MKTEWLCRSLLLAPYFCLFVNPKDYAREIKKLKLDANINDFCKKGYGAQTQTFEKKNKILCIVTMTYPKDRTLESIFALLAHEATHIWQEVLVSINERSPSREMEAYAIQNISQELFISFNKQTKGAFMNHPGFKAVQSRIAKKQGISMEAAGAILASSTRKASASAKKKNPSLKKVK